MDLFLAIALCAPVQLALAQPADDADLLPPEKAPDAKAQEEITRRRTQTGS